MLTSPYIVFYQSGRDSKFMRARNTPSNSDFVCLFGALVNQKRRN
jgi:hypothetical protein